MLVPKRSREGSTTLSLPKSSAGDPDAASSDLHSQVPAPTLLRFSLSFERGCGLPEDPVLLCGGKAPPHSWGCREGKQELKPRGLVLASVFQI